MGTQDNKNKNNKNKNNKKKVTAEKLKVTAEKLKFSRPLHKPSDVRNSGDGNNSTRGN